MISSLDKLECDNKLCYLGEQKKHEEKEYVVPGQSSGN